MNKDTFRLGAITQVYSGKDGKCCCGCNGMHYRQSEAGAVIGNSKEDRMIRRVYNLFKRNMDNVKFYNRHAELVVGSRLYICYSWL